MTGSPGRHHELDTRAVSGAWRPRREVGSMASTRRRKLKKLRMKKANHGKRPLAGK
ncbi:MAG: hypothetical protein JOZ41_01645 [Chloroflexi bacterium]|nr:hypothetical protein [Chloroflexota bacterium]